MSTPSIAEKQAVLAEELRKRDKKRCARCGHKMTNHRAHRPRYGDPFQCSECECADYEATPETTP